MAGDWIKMNKSLPRDPRVVRISSALKADRLRTIGGLLSAWCLFDEQTEDGTLEGYTPEILDEIVGLPGLSHAMASVGWLDIGQDFIAAPRFDEHNGQSAKRRAQDSVRKMSARKADKCPQPKQTKCGPEKRREEKSKVLKPTQSEIVDFVTSIGLPESDGIATFQKWEGNGWMNGGQKIKNWKMTIQSWKTAGYMPSQKTNGTGQAKPKFTRPGIDEQIEIPSL